MSSQLDLFQENFSFHSNRKRLGTFLTAAYNVLMAENKPLSVTEITNEALRKGLLKSGGKTPHNSMRARLSVELSKYGITSSFQRVGKNRFALREWKLHEYVANTFSKSLPHENVVTFLANKEQFYNNEKNGILPITPEVLELLKNGPDAVVSRVKAESDLSIKQLVAYVLLRNSKGQILTYVRGKYSSAHKTLLKGKMSLGFGGHVLDSDIYDLFIGNDSGVLNAATREIREELGNVQLLDMRLTHVIHDCTSEEGFKHFGVVVQGLIGGKTDLTNFDPELSINGVRWLSLDEVWDHFHLFEYWSQLIIKTLSGNFRTEPASAVFPSKRPKNSKIFIIVGEIASGKTSVIKEISLKEKFLHISARQSLVEILQIPDFKNSDRSFFQERAQELISSIDGPRLLAENLANKADRNKVTLIDGIRNISTIKELKKILGDCIVVYIDCPRDKALSNYLNRADRTLGVSNFVKDRMHLTESELPIIFAAADSILYNAGQLTNTVEIFEKWLNADL